ncbi:hypothetical protein OG559_17750 [Micromonospora sp. NBC_01405]|uniref:hypothetical protein n=1 Tax=Micromonospora sp. NBC_01405 TaxID=2903589 RepID=UPI0032534981
MGRLHGSFRLTDRATRALAEALGRWTDPDDAGRCGSTVAHHAARIADRPD